MFSGDAFTSLKSRITTMWEGNVVDGQVEAQQEQPQAAAGARTERRHVCVTSWDYDTFQHLSLTTETVGVLQCQLQVTALLYRWTLAAFHSLSLQM